MKWDVGSRFSYKITSICFNHLFQRVDYYLNAEDCRSSYRNNIVTELVQNFNQTWIVEGVIRTLEIYGQCGHKFQKTRDSHLKNNRFRTTAKVGRTSDAKIYKFYLAFENSRCNDYITEKFMGNSFENGLVPVVSGPKRDVYEKFAPKDSFIHVDDFSTVKDLADHLDYRYFR